MTGPRFEDFPPELDDLVHGHHFDRLGQPIGVRRWMVLHADHDYVRVAFDQVGEYAVSTVWVGVAQTRQALPDLLRILFEGPRPEDDLTDSDAPLIFETLVFPRLEYCVRTATEAEALRAHAEALTVVRTQLDVFES